MNLQMRPFIPLITPQPPGSFVMSIELAQPEYEQFQQTFLFTLDEIVDDVLTNVDLVFRGERETLRERIPDEGYFRNFIAGAKQIAPDGKVISYVGLSDMKMDVPGTLVQSQIPLVAPTEQLSREIEAKGSSISVKGILDMANGRGTSLIGLMTATGETYDVEVLEGLEDFVKTYFKQIVAVSGFYDGTKIRASDIGPSSAD